MSNFKSFLGCLTFLARLLILVVISGVLHYFLQIDTGVLFIVIFFTSLLIWRKSNTDQVKKFFKKFLMYSVLVLMVLGVIYRLFFLGSSSTILDDFSDTPDQIYQEQYYEKGDSITLLSQDKKWKDNYGNEYNGVFSVRQKDYVTTKQTYTNDVVFSSNFNWGTLYKHLISSDQEYLDLIIAKFSELQSEKKLNQLEFAEMVVTFIQDIPYAFVFSTSCNTPEQYEKSIRDLLEKCPSCCIGDIPYGVQNPVGFMGNLKGDCDTRTVIIYTVLNHFGYDVMILNSEYYRHSILGVHLPARGKYKIYQGKRYYVWETTAKHWTLGQLSGNMDDMNHWEIVLTNLDY